MILAHYPPGLPLPAPWQPGWQGSHALDLPSLPRRLVARAPSGTPLPPGAEPHATPQVTEELRRAARADIEAATRSRDQLVREVAEGALDNPGELDRDILAWLGLAHPYALLAPLSVTTLDAACRATVAAGDEWDSRHSSVVIRTAFPEGFDSWIGIGSTLTRVGKSSAYEAAEVAGIDAVRELRRKTMARVQSEILAGWSPETPYYSATIATAADALPIHVHRGPLTAGELVRVHPSSGVAMPASSWDLPVVAEYRGDGTVIERHDERVTWSDEDSRARQRERQQAGDARRKAEEHRALELLRAVPALAPYLTERGLQRGAEIALGNGMIVVAQGPVRMREDGVVALAQVRDQRTGRTMWMAIGHFA